MGQAPERLLPPVCDDCGSEMVPVGLVPPEMWQPNPYRHHLNTARQLLQFAADLAPDHPDHSVEAGALLCAARLHCAQAIAALLAEGGR